RSTDGLDGHGRDGRRARLGGAPSPPRRAPPVGAPRGASAAPPDHTPAYHRTAAMDTATDESRRTGQPEL
ncbi:hypothetical protein, partial [Rhodococcus sp. IEGM 1406]|uniref:hypothetical protein n=1 Tax=Rhodococcus sp. IEGM 1406 TaxID=3047083 RepID=UPI0024B82FC6